MNRICIMFLVVLMTPLFLKACPIGEKEDHLTIQRVMRNLGRFLMPTELIIYSATNSQETISVTELQQAVEKLNLAESCTTEVISNPSGDLLPLSVQQMSEENRQEYIEELVFYMTELRRALQELVQLIQPSVTGEIDLNLCRAKLREIDRIVNRAHQKLAGG